MVSSTSTTPYTYAATYNYPQLTSLQSLANAARVVSAGLKITSIASATSDAGLANAGLIPRDPFSPYGASVAGPTIAVNTTTDNGLPFIATTTATQGYNEFLSYEQTESFASRKGVTLFYRPEDPNDFEFRNYGFLNAFFTAGSPSLIENEGQQMSEPCFVVGLVGGSTSGSYMIESVLHVEYTVGPFSNSVVNTGVGTLTVDQAIAAQRTVFGTASNVVRQGIASGFNTALSAAAGYVRAGASGAAGNIVNRLANYFSSSDNQSTALVPVRGRRRYDLMEVD
jgi:hypothetical protein